MSSFKHKPSKLKYLSNIKTLDEIHKNQLTKLKQKTKELPIKQEQIEIYNKQLIDLEKDTKMDYADKIKLRSTIKTHIQNLQEEVNKTKNNSELLEYISKAGELLVNYYNITSGASYNVDENTNTSLQTDDIRDISDISEISEISDISYISDISKISEKEKEKENIILNSELETSNIDNMTEIETSTGTSIGIYISEKLKLLNQLSQKTRKIKKPVKKRRIIEDTSTGKPILQFLPCDSTLNNINITNNLSNVHNIVNRATLQDKYLMLIDKNYACEKVKADKIVYCTQCFPKTEKTLFQAEGCYVCRNCGETEHIIMESEIPSHKEMANEKQKYPYKKLNHLKEKLNQFQSKESADVPEEICNIIKADLKKNRIKYEECTPPQIRIILKKYKLTAYYEHLQQIYCTISGALPITLSREIEETIINMFQHIQDSFRKHCPRVRSNFLSYSYVLNKLFKILHMNEHAKYFNLLKSKEKLREQDIIWNKICRDMNWKFYSSF